MHYERKDNDLLLRTTVYVWQARFRPRLLAQAERPQGVREGWGAVRKSGSFYWNERNSFINRQFLY